MICAQNARQGLPLRYQQSFLESRLKVGSAKFCTVAYRKLPTAEHVYRSYQRGSAGLLIVPTFQRSGLDLVQMGEKIEAEKDRLLERVRQSLSY